MKGGALIIYRFTLLLLVVAIQHPARAQSPACVHFNEGTSFYSSEVYDLLQDSRGYIWLGTDRGVFRFDGYTFQAFTTTQGLTDNTIFFLQEDYAGRIWVAPFNGRLCYIEDNKVFQYKYNDTLAKYLPGNSVARTIHVLPTGAVEIGYLWYGIVSVDHNGVFKRDASHIPGAARQYFARESTGGSLVLGSIDTRSNLNCLSFSFTTDQWSVTDCFSSKPMRENIKGIARKSGTWCFAVTNDLIEIDSAGNIEHTRLPYEPLSIYEDRNGSLWVGFDQGGGVRRYAPHTTASQQQYEDFYSGEIVTDILEDHNGCIWISTLYNGLIFIPYPGIRCWDFPAGKKDDVLAFEPVNDSAIAVLWRVHGVTMHNGKQLALLPDLPSDDWSYKSVAWDKYNNILVMGRTNNTLAYDLTRKKCIGHHWAGSNSIAVTAEGDYLGGAWDVWLWSNSNRNDSTIKLRSEKIRERPEVLYADEGHNVWMGALNGLFRLTDSAFISVSDLSPLLLNRISDICELADHTLVVATQSCGIVLLRNGIAQQVHWDPAFSFDHISSIAPGPENSFWISDRNGLFRATVSADSVSIIPYCGLKDVVSTGGACFYSAKSGQFWLASNNGFVVFDPAVIEQPVNPVTVYVSAVAAAHDSLLSLSEKPELDYNNNFLRISFCALNYRLHGDIQYRYRLAGQDTTWKYTVQHSVDVAGLQPGDYRFEVEARDERGKWESTRATYCFLLRPPYWQTTWFRMTIIALVLLTFWGMITYRYRTLRKRDLLREQALGYRQQALASQMNPHFVFNALGTIQASVMKEDKTKTLQMFSSFASLLRKSLEHAGERYILLEEDIHTLSLYCEFEKMRFGNKLSSRIIVDESIDQKSIYVPAMLVQPMVENAIRHGIIPKQDGGVVTISFLMNNDTLYCEVDDNGIGRAAAAGNKTHRNSAGTRITEDRLRVLSQLESKAFSFSIEDKTELNIACGTRVRFAIPYITKPTHETIERIAGG